MSAACATSRPALLDGHGHKSYVLPAVEIVALDAAINRGGHLLRDRATYEVTARSVGRNLRSPWVVDDDPFAINQLLHPYQGAMYHGIARSNGLSYWPSMAYTFAGSALWELAGETTPPSRNDQIASGIAGSFLGEPLFRISRLLLERAGHRPGAWRTVAAALASPPASINQVLVGDPAGWSAPDAVPFSDIRIQVGASAVTSGRSRVSSVTSTRSHLVLSFDYGHPGHAGSRYERPFDYFRVESRISDEGLEQVSTRGLIAGTGYEAPRVQGIWGLYGSYDYFEADDFRFSSTAFSFGTTAQAPISASLLMQGSGLVGAGYGGAHSLGRSGRRDNHYGVAPQALANLRLIAGSRAALDLTAREFFISALGGFDTGQRDVVSLRDASLAIRVHRRHAVGLTYQVAHRSSDHLQVPAPKVAQSSVGLFYTFLGSGGFGAVR